MSTTTARQAWRARHELRSARSPAQSDPSSKLEQGPSQRPPRFCSIDETMKSFPSDYPATASLGQTRCEIFSESSRAPRNNSSEQEAGATDPRNCKTRKAKTLRSNFSA